MAVQTTEEFKNGGATSYAITIEYLKASDIKVRIDGALQTYVASSPGSGQYTVNGTTVTLGAQAGAGTGNVHIYRETDVDTAAAVFVTGSAIRAADLNAIHDMARFGLSEARSIILNSDIKDGAVTTEKIKDGTIVNADINASAAIDGTKISPNFGSQNIVTSGTVDGRDVSTDGTKLDTIETNAKDDQTASEIRTLVEAASDSNVFTDADHTKLNGIQAGATADQTASDIKTLLTADKLEANQLAANSVTVSQIQDTELTTLSSMQSGTASILADSTALTATTAELNQLDGITLETTLTSSDTRIPTSKAVNDQILAVTNALGGFVAIADETSFPTSNPDPSDGAGTVVSISQISSGSAISVNGSGVSTIPNGAGTDNTVTITGFPTTLRNTSLAANSGLQVQTTSTLHTYTFHKQLASADDIQAISATVNSFSNRYRVAASAPTSSLDGGDLWYDTTNSKLMVYSSQNSAWEEASAIGNFFISTLSSSSNTGGGSATPNGTAYRFTISDAPVSAQQLLVSVDGVIQKPNSGTSQPSEGFALSGNDIIFGSAPANGASIFVTVIGSTVGIGTPSDNTVTTAILQNGSVTTAKIATDAVTSSKIANGNITNDKLSTNLAVNKFSVNDGHVIIGDANNDGSLQSISGDVTINRTGVVTIANNAVSTAKIADEAVTLAKLEHGTSSNNGKFLRANNGADPSFETVNTDLVADTSPQLGGNLDLNGNDISGTGNFSINGNVSGNSLTTNAGNILINSSQPTISFVDSDANDYQIKVNGGVFDIRDSTNSASRFKIETTGEVTSQGKLNCQAGLDTDGDVQFNTGSTNVNVLFDASTSTMNFSDSMSLSFGDHSTTGDYSISYVNGADFSILAMQGGSQDLVIGRYENAATKKHIVSTRAGVAELYHDNNKKLNTASGGVEVTGTCTATAFAGDGSALTGITSFVTGMILLWSGAANAIPTGWVLCDGNNSTPNLTDRFVVGAGNSYSVGATGGSNTATDTVNLTVSISGNTSAPQSNGSGSGARLGGNGDQSTHNHSFSGSGSGSDTVSIDTRSPYYALCYIMKT